MITVILKTELNRRGGIRLDTLHRRQKGLCFYCDEPIPSWANRHAEPCSVGRPGCTRDHLFPRYHGFGLLGNTVLCCPSCNSEKDNRMPSIHEILKAADLYKHNHDKFIVETRNKKPVIRLD